MNLTVKVGGVWLGSALGSLTYSHAWPGGCDQASWTMATTFGARLSPLVRNASVVIYRSGWPLWRGYLAEPEWSGPQVSLAASGLSLRGAQFQAADSAFKSTDDPTVAITQANVRGSGLGWRIGSSIPSGSSGVGIEEWRTVSGLLDAVADRLGKRWGVDATGTVEMLDDANTLTWHVPVGSGDLGIADDAYASNVVLVYNDSTSGLVDSVVYPPFSTVTTYEAQYGHGEFVKDITDQAAMSAATAAGIAQAVYEKTKQRPGWTNGLELTANELLTPGDTPGDLQRVCGNQMVRLHGVADEVALNPFTDFVIGKSQYTEGAASVSISPVGLVARTQEDVFSELLTAAGLTA